MSGRFSMMVRYISPCAGIVVAMACATATPPTSSPAVAPTAAAPSKPAASDKATLRLSFTWQGSFAPMALAAVNGAYKEQGADVTIQEGTGSADSVKLVGSKSVEFALADAATMMQGVGEGVPVRMVMGYTQVNSMAILTLKESGITQPKQLEGKVLTGQAGGAPENMLPAFYAAAGVDGGKVQFVATTPQAKITALLEKKADAATSNLTSIPDIHAAGKEPGVIRYYDYGLSMLSFGLITHSDTIRDRPDLVRKVVAGSVKGIQQSIASPSDAIAAGKKLFPTANEKKDLETFQIQTGLFRTKRGEGKPFGWMSQDDWADTERLLGQYGGLKTKAASLDAYFTNQFVPGA